MRVTTLGHAALYIETNDQRVLVDPVFSDTLANGALEYRPGRRFDFDALPTPTLLVVTHGHFDHFHRPSLERLPKGVPVVAPEDAELLDGLRELGFEGIHTCRPWEPLVFGGTRLLPTPSEHDEPEVGVAISSAGCTFWHMADAEVSAADARRLRAEAGRIDLVSAKYQPVVRASMGHLRARGAAFDKSEVTGWLEAACQVEPGLVFPYASGLAFAGRHAWFNRYALPLSSAEIVRLLEQRLGEGRAVSLDPGDVVELSEGQAPRRSPQASPFVATVESEPVLWEPVDPSTLGGLDSAEERLELAQRLHTFLTERLSPWLGLELTRAESPWQTQQRQRLVWQLVVETGEGERLFHHLDYGRGEVTFVAGRSDVASSFTHLSGRALLDVLRGTTDALVFWLTGDARSYEKVLLATPEGFSAPPGLPPQDEPGDPLTYFLRHFGPDSEGRPTTAAPVAASATGAGPAEQPSGLDVLARQGETPAVAAKKALLSLLSLKEAERLGLNLDDAAVQATSDEFRVRFGLEDAAAMQRWLADVGLDVPAYSRVMRAFTAVSLVQGQHSVEIASLAEAHAKIASARRRDT